MDTSTDNTPEKKVSIIVPVYNDEAYIGRCLDSLIGQSMADIEIICVNDASTDNTLWILEEYQRRSGIKIISFAENRTQTPARKAGVMAASGEYILFVDADDTLRPNACEFLYDKIKELNVDALAFGSNIINCANLSDAAVKNLQNFCAPYLGKLSGEEFFIKAVDEKVCGGHVLWNRMYRSDVLKKAFQDMEEFQLTTAEDLYTWIVIAYYIDSYEGIQEVFYNYYYGLGVTGHNSIDLHHFSEVCQEKKIVDAVRRFFIHTGSFDKYRDVWERLRMKILQSILAKWYCLSEEDAASGFDMMLEYWEKSELVAAIAKRGWGTSVRTPKAVLHADAFRLKGGHIRTVALYYSDLQFGEIQWNVVRLAECLLKERYHVVIITDDRRTDRDLVTPGEAQRIVIPSCGEVNKDNYINRCRAWEDFFTKYEIDLVVSFMWDSKILLWDLMISRLSGVKFLVYCHSVFSGLLLNRFTAAKLTFLAYSYALADGIVTLDSASRMFWRNFNHNVVQEPVPVIKCGQFNCSEQRKSDNWIVWYGSFAAQAAAMEALEIFRRVSRVMQDAKLIMIGEKSTAADRIRLQIKEYRLENVIFIQEPGKESMFYFHRAAVALCTTKCEGYGLGILLALQAELPVVATGMFHADYVWNNPGIICINPGDKNRSTGMASDVIIDLLQNTQKRVTLGKEGKNYIKKITECRENIWSGWLTQLEAPGDDVRLKEMDVMWQTLFEQQIRGLKSLDIQINQLKRK